MRTHIRWRDPQPQQYLAQLELVPLESAFPHLPFPQPVPEIHDVRGGNALVFVQRVNPLLFVHRRHILGPRKRLRSALQRNNRPHPSYRQKWTVVKAKPGGGIYDRPSAIASVNDGLFLFD